MTVRITKPRCLSEGVFNDLLRPHFHPPFDQVSLNYFNSTFHQKYQMIRRGEFRIGLLSFSFSLGKNRQPDISKIKMESRILSIFFRNQLETHYILVKALAFINILAVQPYSCKRQLTNKRHLHAIVSTLEELKLSAPDSLLTRVDWTSFEPFLSNKEGNHRYGGFDESQRRESFG